MQSYSVFIVLPKLFPRCIGSSQFGTNTYFLVGYAENLFLRISSMQLLVLVMEICIEVRYSVRPNFLWFVWAWRFSTICLSLRFWTLGDFAWLLMLRLRRMLLRTSISIFHVMVSHIYFADAERYRIVRSTFSQLLLTLRRALASAFLFFTICFWLTFLFMVSLLLFVVGFIVCWLLYPTKRFAASTPRWCRSLTLQS